MKAKTVLILAAAIYQVPFIKRAKSLGYKVVTCDNRPENPGHQFAHHSANIDITDKFEILNFARKINADGILSAATDISLPSLAYACQSLNLPGPSIQAVDILCDKLKFRTFQEKLKLPHPNVRQNLPLEEHDNRSGGWVVKPTRSSGSKGITLLKNFDNVVSPIEVAKQHSTNGEAILESYIDGCHGTAEGIISEERVAAYIITDRFHAEWPNTETHGHRTSPQRLPPKLKVDLVSQIEFIAKELKLDGPFDCDFVYTEASIIILEISPRAGGNCLSQLVELSTGFDWTGYNVKNACGDYKQKISPWKTTCCAGAILLGAEKQGKFSYNEKAAKKIGQKDWVHDISFDLPTLVPTGQFENGHGSVGQVIFRARDRDSLDVRANWVEKKLEACAV